MPTPPAAAPPARSAAKRCKADNPVRLGESVELGGWIAALFRQLQLVAFPGPDETDGAESRLACSSPAVVTPKENHESLLQRFLRPFHRWLQRPSDAGGNGSVRRVVGIAAGGPGAVGGARSVKGGAGIFRLSFGRLPEGMESVGRWVEPVTGLLSSAVAGGGCLVYCSCA
jgi:hypothetical protein